VANARFFFHMVLIAACCALLIAAGQAGAHSRTPASISSISRASMPRTLSRAQDSISSFVMASSFALSSFSTPLN
jgi:hypothetical protein